MSQIGYQRYFIDRAAGDNQFNPDWIAGAGEIAKCILLFTFARHPGWVKEIEGATHTNLLPYYIVGVGVHLQSIISEHFPQGEPVSVYFQNNDPSFTFLSKLLQMENTTLRSLDDETMYVTTVRNTLQAGEDPLLFDTPADSLGTGGRNIQPLYRRWWVWALVTTAIAVTAVLVGGDAKEAEEDLPGFPDPPSR